MHLAFAAKVIKEIEMYKLIIVDDEILSRYALITLISKNTNNIQVIAECENGMDAIQKAEELKPDIIIMDIKMPGINGLEASRQILGKDPLIQVLIMTAYDSFDYIQQALSIGVKGYILKPLVVSEVMDKLQSVMDAIQKSRIYLETKEKNSQILSTAIPVLEKNLISSYITGNFSDEDLERQHSLLHIQYFSGCFLLLNLRNHTTFQQKDNIRKELAKRLRFLTYGIAGDYIFDILPVFLYTEKNFGTLSPLPDFRLFAQEVLLFIQEKYKIKAAVSIGGMYENPRLFKNSYFEAMALIHTIPDHTCQIHESSAVLKLPYHYPYSLEDDLLSALRSKNMEAAYSAAEAVTQNLFTHPCPLGILKEYTLQLLVSVKRIAYNLGLDGSYLDSVSFLSLIETLKDNLQVQEYLHQTLFSFLHLIQEQTQNKNFALVKKINSYLQNEPIESLSLEGLASYLKMTPHYVSKLFKDEYNANFVDHITNKKISYAKILLQKGTLSIKEVSERSGYSDQNYFCRIFKKNTGLTPKEYQKYENITKN